MLVTLLGIVTVFAIDEQFSNVELWIVVIWQFMVRDVNPEQFSKVEEPIDVIFDGRVNVPVREEQL